MAVGLVEALVGEEVLVGRELVADPSRTVVRVARDAYLHGHTGLRAESMGMALLCTPLV